MTVAMRNTLVDARGNPRRGITVEITLVPGPSGLTFAGTNEIVGSVVTTTNAQGVWTAQLTPTSTPPLPDGTVYRAVEKTPTKPKIVIFTVPSTPGPHDVVDWLADLGEGPGAIVVPSSADGISTDPGTTGLTSTDVESALAEIQAEILSAEAGDAAAIAAETNRATAAENLKVDKATLTTNGDILTRSGGVPARITRAQLAADAAFTGAFDALGAAASAQAAATTAAATDATNKVAAETSRAQGVEAALAAFATSEATSKASAAQSAAIADAHSYSESAPQTFQAIYSVKNYGAACNDSTDDSAAIQSAINAVSAAGGGIVYIPSRSYINAALFHKSNVTLEGPHGHSGGLRCGAGVTTAAIICASGDNVQDAGVRRLRLDCAYGTVNITGIQATNAARLRITENRIVSPGNSGVILQTGTVDCLVADNTITDPAQAAPNTYNGIRVHNQSHRNKITRNTILDSRGMGILVSDVGSAASTDCIVSENIVRQVFAGAGLECIGVTADCLRTHIVDNVCIDSQDNGISCTAGWSVVAGNTIKGAQNHGIAVAQDHTVITGNFIYNIGQEVSGSTFAYVCLSSCGHCVVVGNHGYDDNGTPNADFAVKLNSSAGNNLIGWNHFSGYTSYITGAVASDLVLDTDSVAGATTRYTTASANTLERWGVYGDTTPRLSLTADGTLRWSGGSGATDASLARNSGGGLVISGDFVLGRAFFNSAAPAIAQVNVQSASTTRAGIGVRAIASQTADQIVVKSSGDVVQSRFNKDGYLMTAKASAPADADVNTSEVALWWDDTAGAPSVRFKGKDSAGSVSSVTVGSSLPHVLSEFAQTMPESAANTSGSVSTANRGWFVRATGGPVSNVSALRIFVANQSGNISVAVYANTGTGSSARPTGAPRATSGAVACPAIGVQSVALGSTITVNDGDWLFLSADNTTATFARGSATVTSQDGRVHFQASAHPAPTVGTLSSGAAPWWIST